MPRKACKLIKMGACPPQNIPRGIPKSKCGLAKDGMYTLDPIGIPENAGDLSFNEKVEMPRKACLLLC